MDPAGSNVTVLLKAWRKDDQTALEQLAPMVEAELRRGARVPSP